jgi:ABC-type multidrug transport system ATPase subunit
MPSLLEIDRLHFGYSSSPGLFSDFSLSLNDGEQIFISGKNGSGKTTLLHIAAGFIKPLKGRVILRGRADGLFINNSSFFFPLSVEENFNYLLKGFSSDLKKKSLEMADQLNFDMDFKKRFREFSTGEKGKIMFIKTLLSPCELLLLDEPFASFDDKSAKEALKMLNESGKGVLYTAHNEALAPLSTTKIDLGE